MKLGAPRILAVILAVAMAMPPAGHAQDPGFPPPPPPEGFPPPPPPPSAQPAPAFTPAQLDQLVAPIALYPDPLLTNVLAASTYPIEIVLADRWIADPNNAALRGDALAAALANQDWDASVKSLVPFPQTLRMMSTQLDWTQRLGNAFLSQQGDVMDSVQRLRRQAQAAGTLVSTPQQVVTTDGPTIVVAPASPQIVYVPYYDPRVVYGGWVYPTYPPVYFPPPPGYYYDYRPGFVAGLTFGIGIAVVATLWHWGDFDWHRREIIIDHDRFDRIERDRTVIVDRDHRGGDTWQHDPYHRRGVAYRDPQTRARFQPSAAPAAADAHRNFRGYDNAVRSLPPVANTNAAARGAASQPQRQGEFPRNAQAPAPANSAAASRPAANAPLANRPAPNVAPSGRPAFPQAAATRPAVPAAANRSLAAPALTRQPPAAFNAVARGPEAKAQADRGRASRETAAPRPAPAPAAARAPARAPSGGQHGGGSGKENEHRH